MDENFGANFARGASVGNMQVLQRERAIELQGQEAMRRIQERNLADQIQQRAVLFKKSMADDEEDKAHLAAYSSILHEQVDQKTASAAMDAQENPDAPAVDATAITKDVIGATLPAFAAQYPRAAAKFVNAVKPILSDESRESVAKSRENIAQTQATARTQAAETMAGARVKSAEISATKGGFTPSTGTLTGPDGKEMSYFMGQPGKATLLNSKGELGGEAAPVTDPNGNVLGFQIQGVNGPHFIKANSSATLATLQGRQDLKKKINDADEAGEYDKADSLRDDLRALDAAHPWLAGAKLSEADKMKVQSNYTELRGVNTALEKLEGKISETTDESARTSLLDQADKLTTRKARLQREIGSLTQKAGPAKTAPAPRAQPSGQRIKVKDKSGKQFTVPAEQLDEALKQGYEKVE